MKSIPVAQEQKIAEAVSTVVDCVNNGMTPNDALFKVAMAESLNPEYVKRLTEVFNTSRMLAHFQTASPEKRADAFSLANASDVLKRMYPEKVEAEGVKAARTNATGAHYESGWFSTPQDYNVSSKQMAKAAALIEIDVQPTYGLPDINMLIKRARSHADSLRSQIDVAKTDDAYNREMLKRAVANAATYFRTLTHIPFEEVETNMLMKRGSVVRPLMDAIYLAFRGSKFNEKRGNFAERPRMCDYTTTPYNMIEEAVKWAHDLVKSASETQQFVEELDEFEAAFAKRMEKLSDARTPKRRIPFPFGGVKSSASTIGPLASATVLSRGLKDMMGVNDDPVKFEEDVRLAADPDQEAALRGPEVQAMLNELMSTDPVISGYPETDVLQAYNELSHMTPRVASDPTLLRGILARRLELGRTDPYEAAQSLETEHGLQRIAQPDMRR